MQLIAPQIEMKSFTCPHCHVLARQNKWGYEVAHPSGKVWQEGEIVQAPLKVSRCDNCGKNCVWIGSL